MAEYSSLKKDHEILNIQKKKELNKKKNSKTHLSSERIETSVSKKMQVNLSRKEIDPMFY